MMGVILVLNEQGDEPISWRPEDPEDVERARREWDRLAGEGYEFFKTVESKGARIKEFDPKLGKVIAAPGVQSKADKTTGRRQKAMAGGPNTEIVGLSRDVPRPSSSDMRDPLAGLARR